MNQKIIEEAAKVKTEIDTAEDNAVSPFTVRRIRNKVAKTLLIKPFDKLPEHMAMDEFRSVKSVISLMIISLMSFVFIDNDTNEVLDVLENRTSGYLRAYFERFDRKNRLKVKTITIDMFEP